VSIGVVALLGRTACNYAASLPEPRRPVAARPTGASGPSGAYNPSLSSIDEVRTAPSRPLGPSDGTRWRNARFTGPSEGGAPSVRTPVAVQAVGALAAAGAACLAYGVVVERRWFRLRTERVPVLPPGHEPLSLLHLSDLHMVTGDRVKRGFLARLAAIPTDLVVLTGDMLGEPEGLDPAAVVRGQVQVGQVQHGERQPVRRQRRDGLAAQPVPVPLDQHPVGHAGRPGRGDPGGERGTPGGNGRGHRRWAPRAWWGEGGL
jgi:hypothetical protein